MKDLGELKYFLGIEVLRSSKGVLLNQRKYALQLVLDLGLGGAKPASTPIDLNQKFTSAEYDKHVGITGDAVLEDITEYQRLIGRLIYLAVTRPDIVFAVQTLSQFMQAPKRSHWEAAMRVVRYIKQSPGMGILLSSKEADSLTVFCDADWASCPNTKRSVTGYVVKFGDSLISWKSKKQQTVSRSSAEAEYRSLAAATSEVVWLLGLFKELGVDIKGPAQVYCDNKAALQIAANPIFHERTKHIEIDCHFVRDKIKEGKIHTEYVRTKDQQADLLTKGLVSAQHNFLLTKLGVLNILQPAA